MSTSPDTTVSDPTRELAAIMFSDIAGYTAIMGRDEAHAMRAVAEHRALLRTFLPKFNGRMIDEIGDGTLTSFHSAVDAVNCARAIQASLEGKEEFRVRIGIHVGEVLLSNNGVYGDGVNVASRIHALADPGGICISERVYEDVRNKPGMQAKDLGQKRLKNVTRPIRVYALAATALDELPRTERTRWMARALAAIIVILLIAALAYGIVRWRLSAATTVVQHSVPAARVIRSIAVLPLDNFSGDPNQEYFSDGMTDELTTDLATVSALRVISRTSVMQFKGAHRPPTPEIAKALNVDAVVEGSVMRVGDNVRITAQLIDARADKHLWAKSYERDTRNVLAMQDEIAQAIANQINVELTPQEQQHLTASKPVNPAAFEAYLKGRHYYWNWTPDAFRKTLQYYQQSVDIDPTFALGYVGLSDLYLQWVDVFYPGVEGFSKAKQDAQKALELNPSLAEVHNSLGVIKFQYEYNGAGAESEFRRAIELNPNYGDAHWDYGNMLQHQGRFAESYTEFEKARQLDPLNPIFTGAPGTPLNYLGQQEKALGYCQQAATLGPDDFTTHACFWQTYAFMGRTAEALAEGEKSAVTSAFWAEMVSPLAVEYALSGNPARARTLLDRLNQTPAKPGVYVTPCAAAKIYVTLDDKPKAFDLFEKCYQERSYLILTIKTDPNLAELRADARFIELLKKIGLDNPADDYAAQGIEAVNQGTADGNARARKLFQSAIDLDPKHALAVAGLGYTFWNAWNAQWDADPASLDKALELGQQAVAFNELPSLQDYAGQFPMAHTLLALAYASKGQYEQAVDEAKRSTTIFPGNHLPYTTFAAVLNFTGRPGDAIEQLKRSTQLDALDKHLDQLGWSYALLGRYDESIAAEKEYFGHNPNLLLPHLVLAFDYAQLNQLDGARAQGKEILRISPKYTTDGMRRQAPYKDANETERWVSAVHKAGLK